MDRKELINNPNKRYNYIIACDPDITRSGVAFLNVKERRFELVQAMTFPELLAYIDKLAALVGEFRPLLVIEDSDSSTNWHLNKVRRAGCHLTANSVPQPLSDVARVCVTQSYACLTSMRRRGAWTCVCKSHCARRGEVQTGRSRRSRRCSSSTDYPADAIKSVGMRHFWRGALQICLFG